MMSTLSKHSWAASWPLLLLSAANGFVLAGAPTALRYAAALAVLAFLPGWVWLNALSDRPPDMAERLTLAVGLSLAAAVVTALYTVYLPGPISLIKLLLITDAIIGLGLILGWRRGHSGPHSPATRPPFRAASGKAVLALAVLLFIAAVLRLPRLGYAEFHEDEAEAMMLGVRLLNGEDYALFLHRKGPAQMLLPVAFWLLTDRISETMARFPFALSSILSVATLFFLGRRWFSWQAGAVAGLLWAINGYAIGFGRMVQYQALIFFLGPLALYCFYHAWAYRQLGWLSLGAFLLATCLLAHFDAIMLLPPAGYLAWLSLSEEGAKQRNTSIVSLAPLCHCPLTVPLGRRRLAIVLALVLFFGLLASFYIPYVFDPEFRNTVVYLSESRVKPGLLYNNLNLLQRLDKAYSSRFYLPLLSVGLLGLVISQSRVLTRRWRGGIVGLGLLMATTGWLPDLWRIGQLSLAVGPWLAFGVLGFWRFGGREARAAWLLFGAALIGYVFFVDDPRTHFYIMYPGAVLLAGAGLAHLGGLLPLGYRQGGRLAPEQQTSVPANSTLSVAWRSLVLGGGILLVLLVITYTATIFLQTESSLNRLRSYWNNSLRELIYDDLPGEREYFGYPKREGWKAIGALRAQAQFPGDFRSVNEDFIIPIWYNYGQARSCYDTPAQLFVRIAGLDTSAIKPNQYSEVAQILREQELRLRVFSAGAASAGAPTIYALEALADDFDQWATSGQFVQQTEPSRRVGTQFGPAIYFQGYDLAMPTVAPGQTLNLNLYWAAWAPPGDDYRAFVHVTDGPNLWGQQDDNPACRLPTSIWREGQRSQGQFRIPIDPATPPGHYPLIIGLYHAETLERLKITGGTGQPGDDFLWLGDVEVVEQ